MTTIVLADDHNVVRHGIRLTLEELGFEVVGEAADGLEAIKLVEELQPDILLCDLMMGSMNGLEVARRVSSRDPKVGIVVLSMYSDESYVVGSLRAGAKGYVLKDSSPEELLQAINRVSKGKHYLGSDLSERAIEAYARQASDGFRDSFGTLSSREREILQMVAQGMTSKDISAKLMISPRTVDAHRTKLMHKLSLHSRFDVIRFALRRGIIPNETPATRD
jgi:DNA-binding NarL/FixJ family response regulator